MREPDFLIAFSVEKGLLIQASENIWTRGNHMKAIDFKCMNFCNFQWILFRLHYHHVIVIKHIGHKKSFERYKNIYSKWWSTSSVCYGRTVETEPYISRIVLENVKRPVCCKSWRLCGMVLNRCICHANKSNILSIPFPHLRCGVCAERISHHSCRCHKICAHLLRWLNFLECNFAFCGLEAKIWSMNVVYE